MPITRRGFIQGTSVLGLTALTPPLTAAPLLSADDDYRGPILVNLFLRGGADALQVVPPVGDGDYYDLRPTLALAEPGSAEGAALELDAFFGLHPALAPLLPLFANGSLAVVHAAGNPSDSHSHFSAQDYMERGRDGQSGDASGWLGRHLASHDSGNGSLFRALAVGPAVQTSLAGEIQAFAVEDAGSFSLDLRRADPARVRETMLGLYDRPEDPLDLTTRHAFDAMDLLAGIEGPGDDTGYPASGLGGSLATLASMIRAGLGVEVASVDSPGWDHHDNLAVEIEGRLTDLAAALTAFVADLGPEMERVTVAVMTEFGRRAAENASRGADHGHGSVMLALGAGVNGGRVYGEWPGLDPASLYGPGDLAVTTDYRLVLGELLARRLGNHNLAEVFPDFVMPEPLGIFEQG